MIGRLPRRPVTHLGGSAEAGQTVSLPDLTAA
jgi:hypothetical protein